MSFIRKFKQEEYKRDPPYPLGTKGKWVGHNVELILENGSRNKWTWSGYVPSDELHCSGVEILDDSLQGAPAPLTPEKLPILDKLFSYEESCRLLREGILPLGTKVLRQNREKADTVVTCKYNNYKTAVDYQGNGEANLWSGTDPFKIISYPDTVSSTPIKKIYPPIILRQKELPGGLKAGDRVGFIRHDTEECKGQLVWYDCGKEWSIMPDGETGMWTAPIIDNWWAIDPSSEVISAPKSSSYSNEDLIYLPVGVREDDEVVFSIFGQDGDLYGVVCLDQTPNNKSEYRYCICNDHGDVYTHQVSMWKLADSKVESRKTNVSSVTNERNFTMALNVRTVSIVRVEAAQAATPSTNAIPEKEWVIVVPNVRSFDPVDRGSGPVALSTQEIHDLLRVEAARMKDFEGVAPHLIRTYVSEPIPFTHR